MEFLRKRKSSKRNKKVSFLKSLKSSPYLKLMQLNFRKIDIFPSSVTLAALYILK